MATAKKDTAEKATKSGGKSINRKKRNAFMRKCLPKRYKTLLSGSDPATFRTFLAAWEEGRKKVRATDE